MSHRGVGTSLGPIWVYSWCVGYRLSVGGWWYGLIIIMSPRGVGTGLGPQLVYNRSMGYMLSVGGTG